MNELPFSKYKFTHRSIKDISKTADLGSEDELQQKCEEWLKEEKIPYIHIGKAIYKDVKIRKKYRGIPDLIIFKKDKKYDKCLLVELKSLRGKTSQGQKNWAGGLNIYLLRSFQDFKELVLSFYNE